MELLGRPIEECTALVNSTASYPLRPGSQLAWSYIAGKQPETPMAELGWASVGILELTALPSVPRTVWLPWGRGGRRAARQRRQHGSTSTGGCASPGWLSSSPRSTWCTSA